MLNKIKKKLLKFFGLIKNDNFFVYPEEEVFKKFSYSQSGEDLIIEYIFKARNFTNFTYLDIGANHPCHINNTYSFYLKGSRGVNIEPNPTMIERFKKIRPDDISLAAGASDVQGKMVYYQMDENELNTFSKEQAVYLESLGHKILKENLIEVLTLNSIINDYFNGKAPNVIFIDAEGMDLILVKSIDFEKFSPEVLCVETISYELSGNGKKDLELIDFVLSKGYMLYADTNINTIFVKKTFWNLSDH